MHIYRYLNTSTYTLPRIDIHVYRHTNSKKHINILWQADKHTHTCTHAHMHLCTHTFVCSHIHTDAATNFPNTHLHMPLYSSNLAFSHTYRSGVFMHMHAFTNVFIHMHICVFTHLCTQHYKTLTTITCSHWYIFHAYSGAYKCTRAYWFPNNTLAHSFIHKSCILTNTSTQKCIYSATEIGIFMHTHLHTLTPNTMLASSHVHIYTCSFSWIHLRIHTSVYALTCMHRWTYQNRIYVANYAFLHMHKQIYSHTCTY